MTILALETSCDETAAAVVRDGRTVLSNAVLSQAGIHALYGGVVPEIASRSHMEAVVPLTRQALEQAGLSIDSIDAIAVTAAPGLIGALLVGVNFAKGLALAADKPLVPVHHIRAHIAAAYLEHPELTPPFTALVASGGHTLLARADTYTDFTLLGTTRDDAAGEALDKIARLLDLGYPGGAALSKLAEGGNGNAYRLPDCLLDGGLDFSFSGVKTAALNLLHTAAQRGETVSRADLAASFERVVTDALVSRAAAALEAAGTERFVLCGGVAANGRLRHKLREKLGAAVIIPSVYLCGDNAAMAGAQAYYEFLAGNTASQALNAFADLDIRDSAKVLCRSKKPEEHLKN